MDFSYQGIILPSSAGAHSSTSQAPVVHQIEEMRETIQKLNDEFMAKNYKEKTLEEKVEHLLNIYLDNMNVCANKMKK